MPDATGCVWGGTRVEIPPCRRLLAPDTTRLGRHPDLGGGVRRGERRRVAASEGFSPKTAFRLGSTASGSVGPGAMDAFLVGAEPGFSRGAASSATWLAGRRGRFLPSLGVLLMRAMDAFVRVAPAVVETPCIAAWTHRLRVWPCARARRQGGPSWSRHLWFRWQIWHARGRCVKIGSVGRTLQALRRPGE
jgi:hypothetical protein